MAMPKKGSRSLVVDRRKYRWSVSRTDDDTGWNDYGMQTTLTVAVEDYENPESLLVIEYPCGFRYGSASVRPRLVETGQEMKVTPHRVAALIREALKQGWVPQAQTSKFKISFYRYKKGADSNVDAFRQLS